MSVRESERELSKIEFLKVLRDIEIFWIEKQNIKPKKYRYFISAHIISHSANAYSNAKMGNSIYAKDDEYAQRTRKHYFQKAYVEIQALISQVDVIYSAYKSDILTNGEIEEISKMMYDSLNLIKSVINSDKRRYK